MFIISRGFHRLRGFENILCYVAIIMQQGFDGLSLTLLKICFCQAEPVEALILISVKTQYSLWLTYRPTPVITGKLAFPEAFTLCTAKK